MDKRGKNVPQSGLNNMPSEFVGDTIESLYQLQQLGRPETDQETAERIQQYFEFCKTRRMRPSIETFATALHCTRQSIFNWSHGIGCSQYKQEIVCDAKQLIVSFLEQSSLSGHLNPAQAIFMLKNWAGYKDLVSFEDATQSGNQSHTPSIEDIAMSRGISVDEMKREHIELPDPDF